MANADFNDFYKVEIDGNMDCENIEIFIGDCEGYIEGDSHYKGRPVVAFQDSDGVKLVGVCNDDKKKPFYPNDFEGFLDNAVDNIHVDRDGEYKVGNIYHRGRLVVYAEKHELAWIVGTSNKDIGVPLTTKSNMPNPEAFDKNDCRKINQYAGICEGYKDGDTHYEGELILCTIIMREVAIITTCANTQDS